jgi:UPF0755 protein
LTSESLVRSVFLGAVMALLIGGAAWVILTSPGSVSSQGVRLAPGASNEPVYVVVDPGDGAGEIGLRLQAAGIIDSASSFRRLARLLGSEGELVAGEYEFFAGTSALDAVIRIRDGLTSAKVVTIPEGVRLEQIGALLEERGIVDAGDFLVAANGIATAGSAIDSDLLSSRPRSATLEGYAYPATYSFRRNIDATEAVLTMLKALSDRLTPDLREEARVQGLSIHQVLTLASIVEREVVIGEERPLIASVYRNRIAAGMPLQADPTVQYAITARPGSIIEFGYWKRVLSLQDLQFPSAYNTYMEPGLPPGPIANPGLDSIRAVIRPEQTKYLYFVARNDGSHAFAETFDQHQINVARYQR